IPGMRAAVSDTVTSGSLPMSSATMASTIWSLFFLMLRADWSDRRRPVTTIAFSSVGAAAAGVCGASGLVASAGFCCAVAAGSGGDAGWASAHAGVAAKSVSNAVVDHSDEFRCIVSPLQRQTAVLLTLLHLYSRTSGRHKRQSSNTNRR